MRLEPLKQWICDGCGEVIQGADQGWLEWLSTKKGNRYALHGFRIVHHKVYSPRKPHGSCYGYEGLKNAGTVRLDNYLTDFLDTKGMIRLLAFLDPGPYIQKEYRGPLVADIREWVELVRRLTLPYYEEARLYMREAAADGFLAELNELGMYAPGTLQEVIKRYGST